MLLNNFKEKENLYNNIYVKEEIGFFIKKYKKKITEDLFIAYLLLKAKKDFLFFCKLFYPYVSIGANKNLIIHTGVKILTTLCQLDFERKIDKDVIINIMPRAGKTTICNILYNAFLIANQEQDIILGFTRSDDTTSNNQRLFNVVVGSELFSSYLKKRPKLNSYECFFDDDCYIRNYTVFTSSIGGNATKVIADDPNDIKSFDSQENIAIYNRFIGSIIKRSGGLVKGARNAFIIQQRTGVNDLTGLLLKERGDSFIHIKIPEYIDTDQEIEIPLVDGTIYKIHRPAGHLINDEKILKAVEQDKKNKYFYQAIYQQQPIYADCQIIDTKEFKVYTKDYNEIEMDSVFITTDYGFTTKTNSDSTCLTVWGKKRTNQGICNLYILEVIWGKYLIQDKLKITKLLFNKWKFKQTKLNFLHCLKIYIEQDRNEDFLNLIQKEELPIKIIKRTDGKRNRAIAMMTALHLQAEVYFPDKSLNIINPQILDKMYNQCECFTGDDRVHDDFCESIFDAVLIEAIK